MNLNDLAKDIAAREGLKKPVSIGQIKEILGIVAGLCWADSEVMEAFIAYGRRKHSRKGKK